MFWPFQGGKTTCAPFREPKRRNIKKRERGHNALPRLRFGFLKNVSNSTGSDVTKPTAMTPLARTLAFLIRRQRLIIRNYLSVIAAHGCLSRGDPLMHKVSDNPLFFLTILSNLPALLLGSQFVDGGGHFVLPGKFLILGRVVGWQFGYLHAEFL
jgi:hypothetical protein